jgi:tetratricopeptide (TPR) repeat protein/class 3 adenylate cyclase/TolB-like protein
MSKNTKKKLAAVMFCKFDDYERYVSNDKENSIKILADYDSVVNRKVTEFNGRIIKHINEMIFAEFPSSTDSINCSLSIHYQFKKENSQNPEVYQINAKVGIHMGEVYEKDGDLFGDGVNLASRIQPISEKDGTVCSQSVYNAIRSDKNIFVRDMGRIAFKNIKEPERVFKVYQDKNSYESESSKELTEKLVKSGIKLYDRTSDKGNVTSVAVLYIKNLGSADDDFFCYGITQDLILDISRAKRMRIPKIAEIIRLKDSTEDAVTIGNSLNVDYVLSGNIMKMNNKFKLSMHLSDTKSRLVLFDQSWEGSVKNVQSIRSKIAVNFLDTIHVDIPDVLLENIDKEDKISPEAYELFIKAKYTNFKATSSTDREMSQDLFRKAIKIQPNYIEARYNYAMTMYHNNQLERAVDILDDAMLIAKKERDDSGMAGISNCYGIIYVRWGKYNKGLKYFEKALELRAKEDNLEEESKLLVNIGTSHTQNGQLEKAIEYFNKAIPMKKELDDKRGLATTLFNTSLVYRRTGDFYQAINYTEESLLIYEELNVNMYESTLKTALGGYHVFIGHYIKAKEIITEAIDVCKKMNDPNNLGMCHRSLGLMYLDQMNWHEAQAQFKKAIVNHQKAEHRSAYEATILFLGLSYYFEKEYDKAKEYIDKAVLITARRKNISYYDVSARAVQVLLRSKLGECSEEDIDQIGDEIINSSSVKAINRECFYISQSYLNIDKQKKADKFQNICKKGLLVSANKISNERYKNDYLNTRLHKSMLGNKAVKYEFQKKKKSTQKINNIRSNISVKSICPQYGEYFNFCPSCAHENIKYDFRFCPDCGTSLERR